MKLVCLYLWLKRYPEPFFDFLLYLLRESDNLLSLFGAVVDQYQRVVFVGPHLPLRSPLYPAFSIR